MVLPAVQTSLSFSSSSMKLMEFFRFRQQFDPNTQLISSNTLFSCLSIFKLITSQLIQNTTPKKQNHLFPTFPSSYPTSHVKLPAIQNYVLKSFLSEDCGIGPTQNQVNILVIIIQWAIIILLFCRPQLIMTDNQFIHEISPQVNPEEQDQAPPQFPSQNQAIQTGKQKQIVEKTNLNQQGDDHLNTNSQNLQKNHLDKQPILQETDKTFHRNQLLLDPPQQPVEDVQYNQDQRLSEQKQKENQLGQKEQHLQKEPIINIFSSQLPQISRESRHLLKNQENEKSMEETPFMWGEEDEDGISKDNRKRSFSQFFINSNLAKSEELFQLEKPSVLNKNIRPNQVDQNVDIWSGLRKSMLEKQSRLSIELKKSRPMESKSTRKDKGLNFKDEILAKSRKLSEFQSQKIPKNMIKIGRSQQNSEVISKIKNMNKIIMGKISKWKKEQKEIQERRKLKINNSMEKIKLEQAKEKEELMSKQLQEKKMRVKAIAQRQQKKIKRKILSTSPNKQENKQKQKEKEKERVKLRKSKTEKNYEKQTDNKSILEEKKQPQIFSMYWNMKDHHSIDEKQKLLRRKIFEQKVREMPVNVNQNKKLQLLIEIDKSNNQLKYNFLNKKGLDDEDIYKNHKDFKIPESSKKIGIKYLQDLREKNKLDDLKRYMSQQSIANIKKYERSWKSPILEVGNVSQKNSVKIWKDEQKVYRISEEDNKYLRALKK